VTASRQDLHAELVDASASLGQPGPGGRQGSTSDLSIDQALVLHSVGWEPTDLVFGVSVESIPMGVWNWGSGEIGAASAAQTRAVEAASSRLREECSGRGGHGVVGVEVDFVVHRHYAEATLVGTAVRPVNAKRPSTDPFVSDLSARDFGLLLNAGWEPVGLAFGTSFVYAPRRSATAALQQKTQNVELSNFTEAIYSARESAMERMQSSALAMGGHGIVAVRVTEGLMPFARHSVRFTAWGTGVRVGASGHRNIGPKMILAMDDQVSMFEATSLKG
jgi:uncharacterized protein YbjQ (UPF0145 family)